MMRTSLLMSSGLTVLIIAAANISSAADLNETSQALFKSHCLDCHNSDNQEGNLDLSALKSDLNDPATMATWIRIHDRVKSGEMPPKDAEQPTSSSRDEFVMSIHGPITSAHQLQKGTVLRRLNRREYQNTINDLFGTNLDLAATLPEDGRSHEFDNVGESLSISMVQLQRYLDAINLALDESIVDSIQKPESKVVTASYADMRGANQFLGKVWLKRPDGAVVFFKRLGYPSGMLREANVRKAGLYKVRVHGYAFQSDKPVTFSIGGTTFKRGAEKPTFGYYAFSPGKPSVVEVETYIDSNYMIEITPFGISDRDNEIRQKGIQNYKGPGLAILKVEVEGPIVEQYPLPGHRLVFEGINRKEILPRNPNDRKKPWYKPKFEVETSNSTGDAERVLLRVAEKAFRRPVSSEEVASYVTLFQSELDKKATVEQALRTAVAAIFCSPRFLYLVEASGKLDDYALASRLSYFLTRSVPDAALLQSAKNRELSSDPKILASHVDRLLAHENSRRMIVDFTDAWLNLRDIEFTTPDRNLFPEYDQYLQFSMLEETRSYLRRLMDDDLPVENIVKSDFAMLNERLAEHYGIDGVAGPEIRSVRLPADTSRGGFLSQGSVLKVSANGTNTSPVVRGVWVTERILGIVPPPPPPGVPGVEPDIRGASTLRELLAKHRNQDNCRACHQMIDPPGFALETFNPIGGERNRYRSLGEGEKVNSLVDGQRVRYRLGPEVDASGELLNGQRFAGFRQYRDQLASQPDLLTKTLATKLLTFATGREMGFSDRKVIDEIVTKSKARGYCTKDLLHLVVQSEIFRNK